MRIWPKGSMSRQTQTSESAPRLPAVARDADSVTMATHVPRYARSHSCFAQVFYTCLDLYNGSDFKNKSEKLIGDGCNYIFNSLSSQTNWYLPYNEATWRQNKAGKDTSPLPTFYSPLLLAPRSPGQREVLGSDARFPGSPSPWISLWRLIISSTARRYLSSDRIVHEYMQAPPPSLSFETRSRSFENQHSPFYIMLLHTWHLIHS